MTSAYFRVNPANIYENSKDGVLPLLNLFASIPVGANQLLISAVAGKRVRIMGLLSQTNNAAQGALQFLNGNAGPLLYSYWQPTTAQTPEKLPVIDTGYFETSTGNGLYATVITQPIICNIFYIIYTP